ncbi:MAG: hypothetical protein FJZ43_00945 [Candidatus Staskawiczbacteria bacterium]|nr:hypothetical protein [Candidatus Staskawiczbacteria bacterium]
MAIIFKSEKKEKKIFLWIMSIFILFSLAIILFLTFIFEDKNVQYYSGDLLTPSIDINFGIMNSDKVKNLEQFPESFNENEGVGRKDPFLPYY